MLKTGIKKSSMLLIMMLTGCVSLAPSDTTPPAVAVPEYISTEQNSTDIDISQIGWCRYFNDPELSKLIEIALQNNTDIRLALLKTEEAYKEYGIEQSNRYPQINAQSSVSYSGRNRDETSKLYNAQVSLDYELDFFGRLKNLSEGQLERYLATQEAQRNVYMLLVSQVAQAYLNEQILFKKLSTIDKQIANYRQSLAFIESRLVSGESTYLEYEQAKGMLETAGVSQLEFKQQQQLAHHTLQNLVNRYDLAIKPTADPLAMNISVPANLPSTALLKRPDIMQAEHQLKATNADIGVARAAFFPSIMLTGNIGNSSTELTDLLSGATLWDLVPKISLPIFNGGQNKLNLELANIRQQQSVVEYEKTVHAAFKEVADLLTLQQSYQQQITYQNRYLITQKNALNLATQGYLNGSSSYLAVLDAQRNVFSTELALLTLMQSRLANEVDLFVALGGGWQE